MENKPTAIAVHELKKSFKKVDVLKGVSFDVAKGSIFALLGSNGAGKTTTINILTTLIKADGGTAIVEGIDVAKQPSKIREHISLTGQFAAVDNRLTARENLLLIGNLRHVKDPAKIAVELLAKFNLSDAADRRVITFSGGMRRRLDIAMSLIGNPSVIFLDEPTTGLDPEARNDMWQTIRKLADSGTTVFLTTQYLEEADQLADTIAVLHQGKIVATGTASELKKLVSGNHITFSFVSESECHTAKALLAKQYQVETHNAVTLAIATDGSTAQVAQLFASLRDAHIEPAEFSQTSPTLDDVFLKLIGSNRKGN
ncbi:MAG TPA: ATP-binding cassette domain-containing protein [Candidatus Saccharimonadia bacterium]|nr:ATP-binding cassette domain-containing protein [Candidatus Saccharimonadia bacterium]